MIENGEFEIANPRFTLDLPQAVASVERLSHLESASVICNHGGVIEGEISPKFDRLLARYAKPMTEK